MDLFTQHARRQLVAWALSMTAGTPLAPSVSERLLLAAYVRGSVSITRVDTLLTHRRQRVAQRRRDRRG